MYSFIIRDYLCTKIALRPLTITPTSCGWGSAQPVALREINVDTLIQSQLDEAAINVIA